MCVHINNQYQIAHINIDHDALQTKRPLISTYIRSLENNGTNGEEEEEKKLAYSIVKVIYSWCQGNSATDIVVHHANAHAGDVDNWKKKRMNERQVHIWATDMQIPIIFHLLLDKYWITFHSLHRPVAIFLSLLQPEFVRFRIRDSITKMLIIFQWNLIKNLIHFFATTLFLMNFSTKFSWLKKNSCV